MATKFSRFQPNKDSTKSKQTVFKYEISGNEPEVNHCSYNPGNFENVVYLFYDFTYDLDVFMCWNDNINEAWIFYGTKGDEFD